MQKLPIGKGRRNIIGSRWGRVGSLRVGKANHGPLAAKTRLRRIWEPAAWEIVIHLTFQACLCQLASGETISPRQIKLWGMFLRQVLQQTRLLCYYRRWKTRMDRTGQTTWNETRRKGKALVACKESWPLAAPRIPKMRKGIWLLEWANRSHKTLKPRRLQAH